jgi:acyl dehydratase
VAVSNFADIEVGQALPELEQLVDKLMIVKYCAAAEDWAPIHWDEAWSVAQGFPTIVAQGWLTFALMCRTATEWLPREIADVSSYAVRYRAPSLPGKMRYGGSVAAKRCEGGRMLVDLDLWAKDAEGKVTTSATLTMAMA